LVEVLQHLQLECLYGYLSSHTFLWLIKLTPLVTKQWQPVTPAMAAGLTDHIWTMEELLSYRVPPGFRDQLDQQTVNNTL